MVKKLYWQKKQDFGVLRSELGGGGVVISSTDTIYGFLANITKNGFNGICGLKGFCDSGVGDKRPFLILVSRENLIAKISGFIDIADIPEKTLKFIANCWPGPVTFIFKAKKGDSLDILSGGKETVAIRCPNHAGLQNILTHFEGLFSTSANKTGMPAPVKFEDIDKNLLDSVNYVVLDAKESLCERASTIIDLSCPDYTQDFPFGLVREGDFSFVALKEIYKSNKIG